MRCAILGAVSIERAEAMIELSFFKCDVPYQGVPEDQYEFVEECWMKCNIKATLYYREPPNIINIAQIKHKCLFSFYPIFVSFSYETSHLEKQANQLYYEDTKKE